MSKFIIDLEDLGERFAQLVVAAVVRELKSKHVILFLSGGSVVHTYDRIGVLLENANIDYSNLEIGQIDERYGQNPLHKNSNQKAITNTILFKHLSSKGVKFRFILHGGAVETETALYSNYLHDLYLKDDTIFLSILGVGIDSHTAGIKPDINAEQFNRRFLSSKLVTSYTSEDFTRITQTFSSLKKQDSFFVYISGGQKKPVLHQLKQNKRFVILNKNPSGIYNELNDVTIFSDIT